MLQAAPGAGKSTVVPLEILKADLLTGKKIIMLEPRRVAVKSIATYLARSLGEPVGQRVGYQIRNERKISAETLLEIVTEGVLTRKLQNDPELTDVGLIIFDEFHERSIHADLALMLSVEVQEALRPDLTLLVMSATIDSQQIASYLNNAAIISCPGKAFPVRIEYFGKAKTQLSTHVNRALEQVLNNSSRGDILIFLPGQAEIKRCLKVAIEQHDTLLDCLPLHGSLPIAEQEIVLNKNNSRRRRVIFATNIAETSLTIAGITHVIDSGLEKVQVFDIKSGLSRLETVYISKASATQRAGRAGRLEDGQCIRLWAKTEHDNLNDFQQEEIVSANLASLTLELCAWGTHAFEDVNWLTPPPKQHFQVACQLNRALGLIDNNNKILDTGQQALKLGVEPRTASMLQRCKTADEKKLACAVAALLSERDIIINADNSDLSARVVLFYEYLQNRQAVKAHYKVRVVALEQAIKLAKSLARTLGLNSINCRSTSLADIQQSIGVLLLKAYPDRLAQLRGKGDNNYLLANGRGVVLRPLDPLYGEPWLVVCDCDGKNKDGLIAISAAISVAQIKLALGSQFSEVNHYALDQKKEKVIGRKKLLYQALVIEETQLSCIPQQAFLLCINDVVKQQGLTFLNWSTKCDAWLARVNWLASVVDDFAELSETVLINTLQQWLLPYLSSITSIKQLKQMNIYDLLIANLTWQQQQFLDAQAPVYYTTPSQKKVPIKYDKHQGPMVSVILQEMFGQLDSPLLAQGQIPLRFELLSPAQRPIQTTSDLANFWRGSYCEVAKEMRAKYPRHRWPVDALSAKPGRSIKR